MPYSHFKTDILNNFTYPSYELNNLKGNATAQPTSYTTYFTITNYDNGVPAITFDQFLQTGASPPEPSIESLTRKTFPINDLPESTEFIQEADSVKIFVKIGAFSGDNSTDYAPRYDPINFLLNDTLTNTYKLTNYYAYDDGVAEYSMGLTQGANQLAYRFDMGTNAKDTINAVSIHYPHFAGESSNTINFFILDDNNGEPGELLYEESIPVFRNNNNVFILDSLEQGVEVEGAFFVGYTQPFSGNVRIGLDKSHDTADKLYHRASEETAWELNDGRIVGSLMIRPHFGKAGIVTSIPEEKNQISVYPNPNDGDFYVKGSTRVLGIINITGQPVDFSLEEFGDQKRISLTNPASGFYIVKFQNGARISSAKICVR
jgi:hypothetical protein